jgi:serine/threonine protein phosphatase PrpC
MIKLSNFPLTDVGKVRQANEDAYKCKIIDDRSSVYVVCDGMGGHVGGAVESQKSVECIVDSIAGADLSNYKKAINDAFTFANDQVYAESINNPSLKGMGTTGVVLVVKNDSCYIGHVGDSRIYLMSDAQLHRLTKDHSFVQQLVDRGELKDEEAENHPMKNRILRAIGIAADIETEVCPREIKVKKGDCFLLCSDGLNGMISDKKIKAIMASENTLEERAHLLVNAALAEGGKDNITAFLIHIDESPHSQSEFVSYNPSSGSKDFSQTQIGGAAEGKSKASRFTKSQKIMLASSSVLGLVLAVFLVFNPFKKESNQAEKAADKTPVATSNSGSTGGSSTKTSTTSTIEDASSIEVGQNSNKGQNTGATGGKTGVTGGSDNSKSNNQVNYTLVTHTVDEDNFGEIINAIKNKNGNCHTKNIKQELVADNGNKLKGQNPKIIKGMKIKYRKCKQ